MRAAFVKAVTDLMEEDENVVLLLADIGAYGFREAAERFPGRVMNLGVAEQAIVGIAAGLAKSGKYPIVHSIAPFLCLRALEFIRNDFGLQELPGMFVSVGASFDYAKMGPTHHCPEDVWVMSTVPGMRVYTPGRSIDATLAIETIAHVRGLAYVRLSEVAHDNRTMAGSNRLVRAAEDPAATVVAVGTTLELAIRVAESYPVDVLYVTRPYPMPDNLLFRSRRVLLIEPYLRAFLAEPIAAALWPEPSWLRCVGVPWGISEGYGTREDHEKAAGLTVENVTRELEALISA